MLDSFLTTLVELWAKYRFPVYEDILGIEPKNKYLQISKTYQKKKFIENWFVIVFTGLVISFHNQTPHPLPATVAGRLVTRLVIRPVFVILVAKHGLTQAQNTIATT